MSKNIKISFSVPANPEDVFSALTDRKKIRKWSGERAIVSSDIGGPVDMFGGWMKGIIMAYKPNKILAYTWKPEDWKDNWAASEVTYILAKSGKSTNVTIEHTGFPNDDEMKEHEQGWHDHVINPLLKFLST